QAPVVVHKSSRGRDMADSRSLPEWMREHAVLRKKVELLERELLSFYRTRSDLLTDTLPLLELKRSDMTGQEAEQQAVWKTIEMQRNTMSKISIKIERLLEGQETGEGLQGVMGKLEDQLYEFKCMMRKGYNELEAEEKRLSKEVKELADSIQGWEKMGPESYHPE
ncbi:unnamed protein product, partial [Discosporangium mesarthrocarpum]